VSWLCASGCAASGASGAGLQRFEFSRLAMGVEARIVLYSPSERAAIDAANAALARIAELEDALSDWRDKSELSRLCARAGEGPVAVGADLFDVLSLALEVSEKSGGAFDPTVGPLVRLWREARRTKTLPDPDAIERARVLVGWRSVVLDRTRCTVRLTRPGLRLDLGAIGKGYACRCAIEVLKARGVECALVQMGGDLVCSAPPPRRAGWSIDTRTGDTRTGETRTSPNEAPDERIEAHDEAVSTSGDDEQFVVIDGRRYSHVIDPRTGTALTTHVRVIVRAQDGALADALSTAAGVLGPDAGLALVASFPGCEALFESRSAAGVERRTTAGFLR
jgi:thiamine biosynthesis lipoprotein